MAQEQFKEALPETFLNTLLQGSRCAFLSSLPRATGHIRRCFPGPAHGVHNYGSCTRLKLRYDNMHTQYSQMWGWTHLGCWPHFSHNCKYNNMKMKRMWRKLRCEWDRVKYDEENAKAWAWGNVKYDVENVMLCTPCPCDLYICAKWLGSLWLQLSLIII